MTATRDDLAQMRAAQAARLFARGRWWREKSMELGQCPDKCLTRAEECEECARIVADLGPGYIAPESPDMRAARASRGTGEK